MASAKTKIQPEKRELLLAQLAEGETVEAEAAFNALPSMFLLLGISIGMLGFGAFMLQRVMLLGMLCNILGMIIAYEASNRLMYARSSCILVTNMRIFGQSGPREISVSRQRLKDCQISGRSLLVTDKEGTVLIKHLSNATQIQAAVANLTTQG